MMVYDHVVKQAFLDELQAIYTARGEDSEKVAGILQAARKALPQGATQRLIQSAKSEGLGDVAEAALKKSKPSARLEQWGRGMRQTPTERIFAAGLKSSPAEAAQVTNAVERMGGSTLGKRMMGGTLEGAGNHVSNKSTLGLAVNPMGVPIGGALEGATRQAGRELSSKGMDRSGSALQRHAGKVGYLGEMLGVGGAKAGLLGPAAAIGSVGSTLAYDGLSRTAGPLVAGAKRLGGLLRPVAEGVG